MLRTIEGVYYNGVVKFHEAPPTLKRAKVLVTFLDEGEIITLPKRSAGGLAGQIWMAEDFNDPLEDSNDYI